MLRAMAHDCGIGTVAKNASIAADFGHGFGLTFLEGNLNALGTAHQIVHPIWQKRQSTSLRPGNRSHLQKSPCCFYRVMFRVAKKTDRKLFKCESSATAIIPKNLLQRRRHARICECFRK